MNLVSTKEIIDRFNISYQTLNYYTDLGFFTVIERRGNRRIYDLDEIARKIDRITALKNQGYPLRLIVRKLNHKVSAV